MFIIAIVSAYPNIKMAKVRNLVRFEVKRNLLLRITAARNRIYQ